MRYTGLIIIALAGFRIAAEEQESVYSTIYSKQPSFSQTLLATRDKLAVFDRKLRQYETKTGLAGVTPGKWFFSDCRPSEETQEFLASAALPDPAGIARGIDLHRRYRYKTMFVDWRWAHPGMKWFDGTVFTHHHRVVPGGVMYFFRTIIAEKAVELNAYLGSENSMNVWLNGKELIRHTEPRTCEPNQETIRLALWQGTNYFLIETDDETNPARIYFSLHPVAGDLTRQVVRQQVWQNLRDDFPDLTQYMETDLPGESYLDWFDPEQSETLERKLIAKQLSYLAFQSVYPKARMAVERVLTKAPAISGNSDRLNLYELFCRNIRKSMLTRCPAVVFIKRRGYGKNGTNATMLGRRTDAGFSVCVYDPALPEKEPREIFTDPDGFIFDMSLSYDAKRLVFSYRENTHNANDSFHIWEMNIDGSGLHQVTTGRWHDASPVYLPDGRIAFTSTRVASFSLCQDFLAAALYTVNPDGSGLQRLEYNTLCDTTPYVMDDGSVLFTRWEYQDKNIFSVQGLWTLNPDGSRLQLFYGNTLTIPNSIYYARQVPGTRKVVCTLAAHHGVGIGAIGLIDRSRGLENPESMINLTPEVPYTPTIGSNWRDRNWGPGDARYHWAYCDPWPVAEDLYLVSYGGPIEGGPQRFRLFLLDDFGNKALLYDAGDTSCFNPLPLMRRPRPAIIAGELPEPEGEGTFFVQNVYHGLLDKGVTNGQVKALRIMSQLPKKYNTEGPRYHDHYPIIGYGTYYVKYCYGTVPVSPDGTVYFKAPAGVELYFQALDAEGKEIRRMGTITQITDQEIQSCIGCHESRFSAPVVAKGSMTRLSRKPDGITPPAWGAGSIEYPSLVQPVLDMYCVRCHSGRTPAAKMDLTGDKSRFFSMSYMSLIERRLVEYYYIHDGPTGNFPPLQSGSWISRLTKLIEDGHQKVNIDPESRKRIYTWIDANVPYYGTWDMSRPHTQGGRDTWNSYTNGRIEPEAWYTEFSAAYTPNCAGCHTVPRDTWINLTNPASSLVLNAHLAKAAGGAGRSGKRNGRESPLFKDINDPVYVALRRGIEAGRKALAAKPRIDMPGAAALPQQRDFGRTY